MSELTDLYQEVILDHNRKPRNWGKLPEPIRTSEGLNPLCGDQLTLYVKMSGDVIEDITFEGAGCAISKASASIMTETVKGKSSAEAEALFQQVHEMLTGPGEPDVDELGKMAVLSGVREFPSRIKCASLSWHTLRAALRAEQVPVSTE
ncbi:MAG: nitrogen fixation protein NifU [Chloroflexota bacterium]|jgi:nitrogen fixation NifU-like protein|nr:nitrogen fixation protein NifU [Chloroflexota bacterium]